MGGSSDQVIGYKYYAGLQVAIGNRIEKFLALRPDDRKWIPVNAESNQSVIIDESNLFGGDKGEGGFDGIIDVHLGADDQAQNPYLAEHDSEIVSAYPNLSYLVYRGVDKGFHLVSMSGMLKEVLYWVKRIHVKNDGSVQWYDEKSEVPDYSEVIGTEPIFYEDNGEISPSLEFNVKDLDSGYISPTLNTLYFPISDFFGSNYAQGDVYTYEQSIKYRIYGDDFLRFDYYRLTFLIKYHVQELDTSPPSGLNIFEYSERDATSDYPVEGLYKYKEIIYICSSSSDLMGLDLDGRYGLERENGSGLFSYTFNVTVEKMRAESNPIYLDSGDINPIHKIREILTDYTAMNKPESDVNDTNFMAAADRIWDEGLGISWAIQQKSCKEAIDELLYHIEGGIRVNRQTGKYEIILFRDDLLSLDTAQSFNESNIKSFSPEISTSEDLINVLNVKFYDRDNIKESSFNVYENGNIRTTDQEIAEDVNLPYFMNRRNAELVANWKLKQLSTPAWKGTFTTGKYDARKLNRYDVIKLSWSNLGIVNFPVRVMKISLGDGVDNTVSIDFVEVVPYSSIDYQPINVDPPTSVILPPQPNTSIAFEMPYFEGVQLLGQTQLDAELANNPDIGYLQVATKKPQNNSLNALLYSDDGTGYERQNVVNYCPFAQLDQDIGYLDTSFALKNVDSISSASFGSVLMIGDEIMVYQSYNPTTKVITVKRGALDTVPHLHSNDANLFFYDEYPSYSTTQYVDSEVIDAKVLTTTPSGVQNLGDATALPVEFNARMIRPYPPANVKINDEYYPVEIETDLVVTWVDRNRLQQTGGSILGWTDGGVALESGASTMLTIKELDVDDLVIATHNINATGTNTYTLTIASMQAETRSIEVTAKTVRDGYDSYQYFKHIVQLSTFFTAPYNITYTVREF